MNIFNIFWSNIFLLMLYGQWQKTIKFPCTGRSRYLHHSVELDSVSPAASSEADAGLSCPPGRVDGAVVTCTVAAPAT